MRSTQIPLFTPETEWVMPEELKDLRGAKEIAIDLETNDPHLKELGSGNVTGKGHIAGIAVAVEGWSGYFPIQHESNGNMDKKLVFSWLQEMFNQEDTTFIFELQEGIRMEIFLTEYNKFGVVNGFIGEPEWGENYHMVMNWFEDDISPDKLTEKYKSKLNMYHQNFWSWEYEEQRTWREVNMFFAFVEKMNLNYYVSLDNYNRDKIYTMNKSKIINFFEGIISI